MARENVTDKGKRLLVEGRLTVQVAGDPERPGLIVAACKGDSGELYALGYDPLKRQWRCTCPEMRGRCSHIAALQLVTVRSDV